MLYRKSHHCVPKFVRSFEDCARSGKRYPHCKHVVERIVSSDNVIKSCARTRLWTYNYREHATREKHNLTTQISQLNKYTSTYGTNFASRLRNLRHISIIKCPTIAIYWMDTSVIYKMCTDLIHKWTIQFYTIFYSLYKY